MRKMLVGLLAGLMLTSVCKLSSAQNVPNRYDSHSIGYVGFSLNSASPLYYGQIFSTRNEIGEWSLGYGTSRANNGTAAITWNANGGVSVAGAFSMARLSTTTIAASDLGMSQFFAVNSLGNFLAVCISTGGVGGSVLASDGATPCYGATFAVAQAPLGSAASFVLLSTGTQSNSLTITGSSVTGNVGSRGTSITNTGTVYGSTIAPVSAQAAADFNTAYAAFRDATCTSTQVGTLAGATLTSGVHCFTGAATLTGTLTLSGTANSIFIIKAGNGGSGALTGTNFTVLLAGGAVAGNVYWWAHDAATFTDSFMNGSILSQDSFTMTRGTLTGRALSAGTVTSTNGVVTAP